jgi:hypothetical protein
MQLSDASKAGAIRDDISNLSSFERIVNNTKEATALNSAYVAHLPLLIKQQAFDYTGDAKNKLTPIEENTLALLEEQESARKDYKLNTFQKIPEYTIAQAPILGANLGVSVVGGITGLLAAGPTGMAIGSKTGTMAFTANLESALAHRELKKEVDANGKPIEKELSAGMSAIIGVTNGALELIPFNTAYKQGQKAFIKQSVKELTKSESGKELVKFLGKIAIAEGSTESMQRLSNVLLGEIAKSKSGKDFAPFYIPNENDKRFAELDFKSADLTKPEIEEYKSLKDKISQDRKSPISAEKIIKFLGSEKVLNQLKEEFIGGAIGGTAFGAGEAGFIATKNAITNNKQEPNINKKSPTNKAPETPNTFASAESVRDAHAKGQQEKQTIQDIVDIAKQSKILKRDPELFKEATAETLGEQSVYLPAEQVQTYFQSKTPQEVEAINAALPDIQNQIQEALDTGGNIVLKGNDMAVALATIPEAAGLQDFMKLSPESFSELEAQDAFLQNTVPSVYYEEQQRKSFTEQDAVKKNIEKQILNLGMPYRDAKEVITKTQAYYDTVSSRVGSKEAQKVLDSYLGSLEAKNAPYKETPFKAVNKIEDLDLFLDKARKPIKTPKAGKPLIKMLKEKGGVQLGSNLAGELAALGINPKTMVGLFRKQGGLGDVDNFIASELQAKFPNATIKTEGDYVDRQHFLDLLAKEINGEDISQAPNAEQEQVVSFLEELDRAGIDINASNEEIKKAIKEFEGQTFNQAQEIKLEQQGRYGSFYGNFNGEQIRISDHPAGKKAQEIEGGGYEGGKRSIGLEQYQELKEEGVKFYASDDFRDIVIPVKAKVDVDLENQVKVQEREIAEQKAFNSKGYQDLYKSELNNELIKLAEQRKKINKKLAYQLTEQDTQDLKQINKRQNEIFESEEYKNQSEQKDKIFKDLVDKEFEQLTEQEKEQAKTKAKEVAKDRKKDSTIKSRAKEKAVLDKFKKIEPFIKNKILELEGQTYFQTQPQTQTPTFYSALEKQITDLPQGKGSPEQWAGIIKNLTQKGVKQEELDWTGVEDWIKEQKGSVSKEQILDYLKANKIEVEEVVKGETSKPKLEQISDTEWNLSGYRIEEITEPKEDLNDVLREDGYFIHYPEGDYFTHEDSLQSAEEFVLDRLENQDGVLGDTKFSKYTLAGGENYRELLMTLPEKGETPEELKARGVLSLEDIAKIINDDQRSDATQYREQELRKISKKDSGYKSSHYDEKNILAHIRFNERTDKDGARVMFVEELQSDWHQEGRKKGYSSKDLQKKKAELEKEKKEFRELEDDALEVGVNGEEGYREKYSEIQKRIQIKESEIEKLKNEILAEESRIPNAPFKTTWNELAFKRALLWAVENNFDKVAWTTGEQQAERYDLSKQIQKVSIWEYSGGAKKLQAIDKNENQVINKDITNENEIEDYIGKDLANKLINSPFEDKGMDTKVRELSGVDLKVGGEGMKAFYDKIVPTMVNKLAKKFGGKVETSNIKEAGNVWSLEITPAMRDSIQQQGLPLFQGETQAPRGQTQFLGQKPIITLFEGKNKSTVLHELGHVFLQINRDIAAVPNVSEQIKKDWTILENWLGIKDGNITTEAHEKFARGFESYLREGKAPSIALRDAFRRFKAWLIRIYKDVSELNVKLTNEVRGVFDRMLATDEAIESLKNNPIFRSDDQISELLTAAEKKDYQRLNDIANEKAKEKLLNKALKQKEIENKKFYKEERAAVKKEVESEMNQNKTFRVVHFLKTGQLLGEEPVEGAKAYKLSREDIKNNYDTEFLKYLPADILAKDGVPVDLVAEEFGFNDAGQMLYAIANVPNFKEELKKATDAEMVRRYGDMLYDGTIENEALDASENEARANKILYELNAANRKVKTFVETKEAYKQKAKEIIATKQIKDATDTNTFYLNEVKAAREAGKALGQKDYEKAVEWKKKQLLNHYLFRESLAIKNEVQKALKSYTRIKKKPKAGKVIIDEDFRLKAVNLLQDFNLAPKGVDYQKTNVADLETWKQEQTDSGVLGLVEFPELAEFRDKDNIRSLTTDQFRTLDDAIQNLVTVGRNINILEVNGKKQELNSIVNRIIEQANTNIKEDYSEIEDPTEREKLVKAFDSYASSLIKTSQTTLKIDGEKNLGEFYQLFEKDLNAAELEKHKMSDELYKKVDAIYNKHFGGYKISDKRTYFDSVGKSYSKKAVLAFALNWGNEVNRTRVRDGFNYSDAQVIDIISSLNKNELEFVQDIWNLINEYWPAIESTEKKLFGIAPKKQKSAPLKIISKDGQEVSLKGGYYPLSYTAEANFKSDKSEDLKQTLFGTGFDKVNFHKSFTKERAAQKINKKIVLDLNPLSKHLTQVITDIAMKPAAWNAYRIINNRRLKTNLVKKIGIAEYKQLQSWVYDMYGRTITQEGFIAKAANLSRDITVTWTMAFKLATAIIQPTGLLQSIVKVGYKNMGLGIWKALGNGNPVSINKAAKLAFAKSKILENRSKTMTRDIYEVIDRLQKAGKLRKDITKFAFLATTKMQMLADLPTWYGAYYKGLKDFNGDDAKAVELADRLLIETQGSSYKQSLSAIQRDDSALVKAFTIFGNYANVKLNLLVGSYRQTNFKKPKDTAKFISDFVLLFVVDAILTEFLREGVSNLFSGRSEDDEEDKALHYANLITGSLISPIPVASQIYSGWSYGKDSYNPSGFKGISIVGEGISKLGGEAINAISEDEEVDLIKVMQGINETSAIFTMGGGAQIDIFLKALKEENEGNEPAPIDFILKPPRK